MTSPPLDTQIPDADARDEFLALLLGAEATLRRVDRLLARRHPAPVPLAEEDAVLCISLGWVSLRRTLAHWLAEAARDAGPEPNPPAAGRARRRAGLLR